jgi:hypothetical protein
VAQGLRTPVALAKWKRAHPSLGRELSHVERLVERQFGDMQVHTYERLKRK